MANDVASTLVATVERALKATPVAARQLEAATRALGLSCISAFPHPSQEAIFEALFKTSGAKLLEVNITAGRALSLVAAGSLSVAAELALPTPEESEEEASTPALTWDTANPHIERLLKSIFEDKAKSHKAADRQAACVWLTGIASELGVAPVVQKALPRIQHVLLDSLSEGDDILQEMASRGLSVCYDLGTPEMKEEMVQALVNALASGHRSQVSSRSRRQMQCLLF
jgi:proteasome component ECM29